MKGWESLPILSWLVTNLSALLMRLQFRLGCWFWFGCWFRLIQQLEWVDVMVFVFVVVIEVSVIATIRPGTTEGVFSTYTCPGVTEVALVPDEITHLELVTNIDRVVPV